MHVEATEGQELRPEISRLAADRGWVLWELRREQASLEQLFHELTMDQPDATTNQPEETMDQPEEEDGQ